MPKHQAQLGFDFTGELAAAQEELRLAQEELDRAQRAERYDWSADFPPGLTRRQYLVLQIRRDMYALEECTADTEPDLRELFEGRIQSYREYVKELDAAKAQ